MLDGITIGRCVHHIFILSMFPLKKTAAKPLAERSEANKVYIYLYTAAKPLAEWSEANKVYIYLFTAAKPLAERSKANKKYISTYARGGFNIRLGTYNVPEGPSANP